MKLDNRLILAILTWLLFALWLGFVGVWYVPLLVKHEIEPMLAVVTAFGVGGVTQFYTVVLTLVTQFYYRKKEV